MTRQRSRHADRRSVPASGDERDAASCRRAMDRRDHPAAARACAATVAIVTASMLAAPGGSPTIVLEAHVGQRSAEAASAIAPVLDELERRGFAARSTPIVGQLYGRAPRPGVIDRGKTSAEMVQLVDRGLDEFAAGSFGKAQATLRSAVQLLQRNPAVTVVDPASTGALFKALIGLAQSQARVGDTAGSVATMTELVRAYPAQEVRRADYGPEPETIY